MKQLKSRRIPVIWTLHDCWSFTGHCAYFDSPKCDRWHTGCGSCPRLHDYPESWLVDRSAKNLSEKKSWFSNFPNLTLVTPSRWLKDLASQSYLSQYPIQVIPNGIDLNNFKHTDSDLRTKHNLIDKKVYLSVAMVWDRRKGLYDIVRFAETLTTDEALIVIGLTPKQIEQLPNTMIKIARTSSVKELTEYYSLADVTVVPSYEDNYPTVVLESLACGTPVVAYATGGIPEMEQSPYLTTVEKGDLDALGACLRTRTKIQSWSVDVSRFDKTQSAKAMVDLYQSVLVKKGD
jgi:glycosyltransferase involved in cell wall biosynthesis